MVIVIIVIGFVVVIVDIVIVSVIYHAYTIKKSQRRKNKPVAQGQ